jgi:hypothetical protein
MKKIAWTACQLALIIAVTAGCAGKQAAPAAAPPAEEQPAQGAPAEVDAEAPAEDGAQAPAEEKKADSPAEPLESAATDKTADETKEDSMSINVYYTDADQTELLQTSQEISYPSELQKYKQAFLALQRSGSDGQIPLWSESIKIQQIRFENGALTLNISLPDEARLGAGGESLALEALTKTMFQFPEVETLDVLVEGKAVESLMGHVELEHPIKRNN